MYEDSSMPTKIPQSVRKRDNKVKTFAPKDSKIDSSLKDFEINSLPKSNKELNRLKNLEEEYQNITKKNIFLIQIKYQILKRIVLLIGQHLKN